MPNGNAVYGTLRESGFSIESALFLALAVSSGISPGAIAGYLGYCFEASEFYGRV